MSWIYLHQSRTATDDSSYEQYREKKAETDAKYKAKKARQEHEDGEWHGIEDREGDSSDDQVIADDAESSDDDDDDDGESGEKKDKLMTTLDDGHVKGKNGLSKKAAMFFDQDIFADIDHNADEESEESEEEAEGNDEDMDMGEVDGQVASDEEMVDEEVENSEDGFETEEEAEDEWEDDGIEIVRGNKDEHWDANELPVKNGKLGNVLPTLRVRVKLINRRYQYHHRRSYDSRASHRLW